MSRKMIFGLMVLVLGLSVLDADDLRSKYKSMMNSESQQSTNISSELGKFISKLKKSKKDDFETVEEFDKRMNDKIEKSKIKKLSAGTISMESYNPDTEEITVNINWHNDIPSLIPNVRNINKTSFVINKDEAKKVFSKKQNHDISILVQYTKSKMFLTSIIFSTHNKFYTISVNILSNNLMYEVAKYRNESAIAAGIRGIHSYKSANWKKSKEYCQQLMFLGYTNWRLPTKEELLLILSENKITGREEKNLWSSTIKDIPLIGKRAWRVKTGMPITLIMMNYVAVSEEGKVMCVRDIE